jgi:translation elongation factor EF-Tu-like GTPase
MTVSDVFHIPGRGNVVTGRLQGNGDIGVLLRKGPAGDVLRGRTVTFEPGTAAGSPQPGQRPGKRRWRR